MKSMKMVNLLALGKIYCHSDLFRSYRHIFLYPTTLFTLLHCTKFISVPTTTAKDKASTKFCRRIVIKHLKCRATHSRLGTHGTY